jgi:hypothetical protein
MPVFAADSGYDEKDRRGHGKINSKIPYRR